MSKVNVKNGTPVGSEHLCRRCTWGQFVRGYRDSDLLVICTNASPNFRVPFTVYDCSEFSDGHRPSWEQMDKLAIAVAPVRVSAPTKGFGTVTTIRVDEDEDEAAKTG